jgi:hypothetical protein
MPNGTGNTRAHELARNILDDFRGAGYYADPKILSGLIRVEGNTDSDNEQRAIEIIRLMLRAYGNGKPQEQVMEELTSALGGAA